MNQGIQVAIDLVMPAAIHTGLFRSRASFQLPPDTFTASGAPTGPFVDYAPLQNIACMVAPPSPSRITPSTTKNISYQQALNANHALLAGYFPDAESVWRAGGCVVIDGELFSPDDIMSVESDSQQTQTRIYLRVVTE